MVTTKPMEGRQAPSFEIEGLQGKAHSLRPIYEHGAGILIFFKTECPTCRLTFPFVERLYQRLGETDIGFLAIGQNTKQELKTWRKELQLSMPMALDPQPYAASSNYQLIAVPTFFLINQQGIIQKVFAGHSKTELENLLKLAWKTAKAPGQPAPIFTAADANIQDTQPG